MAVVFSDNVIEIAVIQEYHSRPVVNVWHMRASDEWFPASAGDIVRDFANNWQDHVMDGLVAAMTLVRFDWRSLDPSDSSVGTVSPDPAKQTVGSSASAGLPPNVAMLINKRTEGRPRGARDGRAFICGYPEASLHEDGTWAAAALSTYQGQWGSFYAGISDTGTFTNNGRYPVVLETTAASRAPGPQQVTVNSRRVTSLPIDPLASTQRDRLR